MRHSTGRGGRTADACRIADGTHAQQAARIIPVTVRRGLTRALAPVDVRGGGERSARCAGRLRHAPGAETLPCRLRHPCMANVEVNSPSASRRPWQQPADTQRRHPEPTPNAESAARVRRNARGANAWPRAVRAAICAVRSPAADPCACSWKRKVLRRCVQVVARACSRGVVLTRVPDGPARSKPHRGAGGRSARPDAARIAGSQSAHSRPPASRRIPRSVVAPRGQSSHPAVSLRMPRASHRTPRSAAAPRDES
mmetsp:Transcript_23036/g.67866  ORF Transcript_23036/g.67866 Transcript_23036/m.67866 type:complete len:255 (-) Transcript_23036:149-913(-)